MVVFTGEPTGRKRGGGGKLSKEVLFSNHKPRKPALKHDFPYPVFFWCSLKQLTLNEHLLCAAQCVEEF